jgi:hypothetical protein
MVYTTSALVQPTRSFNVQYEDLRFDIMHPAREPFAVGDGGPPWTSREFETSAFGAPQRADLSQLHKNVLGEARTSDVISLTLSFVHR